MKSAMHAADSDYDSNTRVTAVQTPRALVAGIECLVVIHTPIHSQLGRRYVLENPTLTIGRGRDNDIVLPSDCVSRQHVRIERRAKSFYSVDLASTNGTYVNDATSPVIEHCLTPGDQLKIGDTIMKFLSGSDIEAQYHEIIFSMTITDGLTNLYNRKQLDAAMDDELARSQRHGRPLAVLMLDIDHFKRVNDTYGHLAGDSVLRGLAALLQKRVRPTDKLGRYGGEEFCAILPETSHSSAMKIADDLRKLIEAYVFVADQQQIKTTVSIGVGSLQPGVDSATALYKSADAKLYEAKRTGRNKVC